MSWEFASLWDRALTFQQFIGVAGPRERELWASVYRTARIPEWATQRARALGRLRLVVLAEDWCGDASSTVPVLARWAEEAGSVELRILERDRNPQVMDRYLTNGARSIPLAIVLTDRMEELGHWGPRPAELQAFVLRERAAGRTSRDYHPEVRRWYAKDKGESTLREVLEAAERASAVRPPG